MAEALNVDGKFSRATLFKCLILDGEYMNTKWRKQSKAWKKKIIIKLNMLFQVVKKLQ